MSNAWSTWWIMVEIACRILGISTATVSGAVGVETLQQGDFNSLGIYLLVSSAGTMIFELAYFLDALLLMCLPCPPDCHLFTLWGKMAQVGGFQKFLYYSIMSVVCFLHPVLVWHATIPGVMLLVTALFNFILSKKTKKQAPKTPQESYVGQGPTMVYVTEGVTSDDTLTFLHTATGKRVAQETRDECHDLAESGGESFRAMLELKTTTKGRKGKERRLLWMRRREEVVEREMEEMRDSEPESTSDTAPMITD
ncbi:transmembrane protein 72 [Corythoichthys intestinalis]|uniref:transmembrane protein 72 n=1 Tax=Corythoichthys intestinalis TaxID=161448 RepID=UPI0025A5C751|nr:transmembrane protein 72 [Corythoichthys intestinalis]XP_061794524.1 transmembrane protein 72-like [Nerophis lumbriciformis]